jgi:hypothetical protein
MQSSQQYAPTSRCDLQAHCAAHCQRLRRPPACSMQLQAATVKLMMCLGQAQKLCVAGTVAAQRCPAPVTVSLTSQLVGHAAFVTVT